MTRRFDEQPRCSYVVVLDESRDRDDEVTELAHYLSSFSRRHVEVVVADGSQGEPFERNRSVLRWVSSHTALSCTAGAVDHETVRALLDATTCEKVIVAGSDVRYTAAGIAQMCELLDLHEAVEPQDYFDPLPWWSGVEMSGLLMHRAFDSHPGSSTTLGVRRSALLASRSVRAADGTRIAAPPLTVEQLQTHRTAAVFVRRRPPELREWLTTRTKAAAAELDHAARTVMFLIALPLLLLLGMLGGAEIAGSYAGVIAVASVAVALRGCLAGKAPVPLRACLFAPLWLIERSVSIYGAAIGRWRAARSNSPDERERVAQSGSKAASGE